MKPTHLLVTFTLTAALLSAQIRVTGMPQQQQPPPIPTGKPGTVEGTVTNSVSGQPIKKATVTLHNPRFNVVIVAVSDASGHFRFDNVPPDPNYYTGLECPGYSQDQQRRVVFPGGQIAVAEDQHVTGVALKLVPLSVIAGKVLDENGEPVPNALVQSMRYFYQMGSTQLRQTQSASTDDRGEYRLYDLQPGRYYVQVTNRVNMGARGGRGVRLHSDRPDEAYPSVFFPNSPDPSAASPAEVKAGAELTGIDFRLRPIRVFHVRGSAADSQTHQPIHGASVQLQHCASESGMGNIFNSSAGLQADGTFDFANVEPGAYCVILQNFQPKQVSFAKQPVSVGDHDVNGVVVSVQPGVQIRGSIAFDGAPPSNFKPGRIALMPVDGFGRNPNSTVVADNSFVLDDVMPVRYQLQNIGLPGAYLKSIRLGDSDASDGILDVTGATTLTLVVGTDPGRLNATVQMPDGSPGMGIMLTAAPADGLSHRQDLLYTGIVAQNGQAQFRAMAPGRYRVFAWENPDYNLVQSPEFRKLLEGSSVTVTVSPNGQDTVQVPLIPAEKIDEAVKKMR